MDAQYILTFAVLALATYELTDLIVRQLGPFDLFEKMREALPKTSMLGKLVRCVFCTGMYVGFAFALLLPYYGAVWYFVTGLALASISALLFRKLG